MTPEQQTLQSELNIIRWIYGSLLILVLLLGCCTILTLSVIGETNEKLRDVEKLILQTQEIDNVSTE